MANTIKIKRGSGSDPAASDMVLGEPVLRTDTAELFFKKDDGSVAKVSGGGGGPDFKYLALRNAANNGAASYPNADFTLVTSGTTNAKIPSAANTLLVSVNGVIQKPNTGTSTPSSGFALNGSTIQFAANISAAPDFILYQESGGIGEPSDETVTEAKLKTSNSPVNGYFLTAQSGNAGGLTWAAPNVTGNAATATALQTARTINGVSFDGTANITVTAAAGTLSGTTLNSSVTASSLTSLGDLGGLTVNGDMSLTGANYNVLWDKSDTALEFADNAKAVFGTGSDLQIYHDGTNSLISDAGNGYLKIDSNGSGIYLTKSDGESMASFITDGAVELFHNGSKKFETTSTGATIQGDASTGTIITGRFNLRDTSSSSNRISWQPSSSILKFNNNYKAAFGDSSDLQIYRDGTNSFINNSAGSLKFQRSGSTKILFDTNGDLGFVDSRKAYFGDGADLQIYHDSNHSYISESGTGNLFLVTTGSEITLLGDGGNDYMLRAKQNDAVELYFNANKKAETVTGGFTITGTCTATSFAGDGSNLTGISAGATGGGSDEIFYENDQAVTTDYTITSGKNAMSAGPITINNGVSVTVPSGSTYTIV